MLGRTLDELPPQTRKLLNRIYDMVDQISQRESVTHSHCRFSRRDIREFTSASEGQLKIHCKRLEEMEYLIVHTGGRGRNIEYELLYEGDVNNQKSHLMGLVDVNDLHNNDQYDAEKLGQITEKLGPSQPQVRGKLGASQGRKKSNNTTNTVLNAKTAKIPEKSTYREIHRPVLS